MLHDLCLRTVQSEDNGSITHDSRALSLTGENPPFVFKHYQRSNHVLRQEPSFASLDKENVDQYRIAIPWAMVPLNDPCRPRRYVDGFLAHELWLRCSGSDETPKTAREGDSHEQATLHWLHIASAR